MVNYALIRSNRKTIAIQVKSDGQVIVRAPVHVSQMEIRRIVDARAEWIERHLLAVRRNQQQAAVPFSAARLKELADAARRDIPERVARYAALMRVTCGRITIRAQRTRWGSCSAKGDLNFNCLLMLCPQEVRDYVVVHELSHRKELNHSACFWHEVAKVMPDYAVHRRWLKEHGGALISGLERS